MKLFKNIATPLLSTITFFATTLYVKASWTAGMEVINNPLEVTLPGGSFAPGPIWILLSLFLWLLKIFMILGVISFVIAGIVFLVSTVNPELRERAKNIVTYSIIAIIIGFSGILILVTILSILTGASGIDYLL